MAWLKDGWLVADENLVALAIAMTIVATVIYLLKRRKP
jgi:hypothetical protein